MNKTTFMLTALMAFGAGVGWAAHGLYLEQYPAVRACTPAPLALDRMPYDAGAPEWARRMPDPTEL